MMSSGWLNRALAAAAAPDLSPLNERIARIEGAVRNQAAQLAQQGRIGPEETVVAVISGNGLKTIQDHPDKSWPEMVACNLESMGAQLEDFRRAAATVG